MKRKDLICTVTGAAGFVGSHLCRRLLNDPELDIQVYGVDVADSPRIADLHEHENFRFDEWDVKQPMSTNFLACDTLYHFAGIADPKTYIDDPVRVMDLNLKGLFNILDRIAFWSSHRPRIVFSSTSEVYGLNHDVPFSETESELVFGPTQNSRWCYAMSKAVCEHYLHAYGRDPGAKYTIFRFFNFVGPGIDSPGNGRVITRMVANAIEAGVIRVTEPGTQTRTFCSHHEFVEPLARATTFKRGDDELAERYNANNWVINLGSSKEWTMWELAEAIVEDLHTKGYRASGGRIPIMPVSGETLYGKGYQDMQQRKPRVDLAREVLGWEAKLELEDFLPEIIDDCIARMGAK